MPDPCHRLPVRVYFEDTDAGGIAYHTAYLRFAERGRTEFLRELGFDHGGLRASAGAGFAVARCEVDFLKPAFLDDLLQVSTALVRAGGASAVMAQSIGRDGETLARLRVRLALLGRRGRPVRLPDALRHAFATTVR